MFRILVTDTLAESGLAILRGQADVDLDYRPGLAGDALHEGIGQADALITRSGTAVTEALLAHSARLKVVGRAGVGLDNVDVPACTRRGVLVINAPTANILSATEHTMAMLLSLCRNIPGANASVRAGEWKRATFMGVELGGKTLGVIGLGRIGGRVATRARAFGMRIFAYDPYITEGAAEKAGADLVPFDTVLAEADVITVHTPLTEETRGIIGSAEIARMKDGVILINCARGGIYEESALADALVSGKVAGAAIDVYVDEPPATDHPLFTAPNVVLTPHIAANTIEAQDRVAVQTAEMVVDALRGSIFVSAVNLPFEGLAATESSALINLSERLGSFAGQIVRGRVSRVTLELRGVDEKLRNILSVASIKGLLQPVLKETINYVNASSVASQRGIDFASTLHQSTQDYTHLVTLTVASDTETMTVSGTVFGERIARIVAVNDFRVEFEPAGCLLYMVNRDVPGVIGRVGTILGDREINIAEYNLARVPGGGRAMAVVAVDTRLDDDTLAFLRSFKEMEDVRQIEI